MSNDFAKIAVDIVSAAGGKVVGRTRFQKIGYLLSASGYETGMNYVYKHYGPYCEDLAIGAQIADLIGVLNEEEHQASWGGTYSIFTVDSASSNFDADGRRQLASKAAHADAVELELAATAVFLSNEGYDDPWSETMRRKPEKADNGRIEKAKALYKQLSAIDTPVPLPDLP